MHQARNNKTEKRNGCLSGGKRLFAGPCGAIRRLPRTPSALFRRGLKVVAAAGLFWLGLGVAEVRGATLQATVSKGNTEIPEFFEIRKTNGVWRAGPHEIKSVVIRLVFGSVVKTWNYPNAPSLDEVFPDGKADTFNPWAFAATHPPDDNVPLAQEDVDTFGSITVEITCQTEDAVQDPGLRIQDCQCINDSRFYGVTMTYWPKNASRSEEIRLGPEERSAPLDGWFNVPSRAWISKQEDDGWHLTVKLEAMPSAIVTVIVPRPEGDTNSSCFLQVLPDAAIANAQQWLEKESTNWCKTNYHPGNDYELQPGVSWTLPDCLNTNLWARNTCRIEWRLKPPARAEILNAGTLDLKWGATNLPGTNAITLDQTVMEQLSTNGLTTADPTVAEKYRYQIKRPSNVSTNRGATNRYEVAAIEKTEPTIVVSNTGEVKVEIDGKGILPGKYWRFVRSASPANWNYTATPSPEQKERYDWNGGTLEIQWPPWGETTNVTVQAQPQEKEPVTLSIERPSQCSVSLQAGGNVLTNLPLGTETTNISIPWVQVYNNKKTIRASWQPENGNLYVGSTQTVSFANAGDFESLSCSLQRKAVSVTIRNGGPVPLSVTFNKETKNIDPQFSCEWTNVIPAENMQICWEPQANFTNVWNGSQTNIKIQADARCTVAADLNKETLEKWLGIIDETSLKLPNTPVTTDLNLGSLRTILSLLKGSRMTTAQIEQLPASLPDWQQLKTNLETRAKGPLTSDTPNKILKIMGKCTNWDDFFAGDPE